ncbi:hypothetical protein GLOTRDRAFT_120851 [Gloeophyllum trabeum ATCC 11539]|uniref:Nitrogen regulatory protein areA GATA-like domain-containing protein n=1 Tax=Gloeophyllum trabeum (strain ATCC 11539 / FP-39264 / Madison 617) TaxID=670483 RepID=S7Q8H3_GLOTA|nr:uncharacterized protein GLOTRDRAFT_120851 [Gloeophyllum trabeum ATCC 11539]EPQ56281.1 hypothetical protein GLOTRDRAFT_120851 [Gloeophyllum trabeum ATCC 11539]
MANYLPALLVSVTTNAFPDDSSFDTVPSGQVDYLSHQWREEDVWRSWRSMTKQRNAIANGARLENASWRTWWKQRNGLKTISPESLNWLKDSDVTWLYGPLHIGQDWSPPSGSPPKSDGLSQRARRDSTGSLATMQRCNSSASLAGKKPILKHRSIGELLSLPSSPRFPSAEFPHDDEEEEEERKQHGQGQRTGTDSPSRPPLLHTKSDTHIVRLRKNHPEFRKDSPPRIIAPVENPMEEAGQALSHADAHSDVSSTSAAGDTPGSDRDSHSTGAGANGGKKKHITFNTFVEQCIAIEKPTLKRGPTGGSVRFYQPEFDEGYDEDADMEDIHYEDFYEEPAWFPHGRNSSESDEEDDEVLEMRSSRSRSSSSHSSRGGRPALIRMDSLDKEHVTIAPIAPTILKTTGVNGSEYDSDSRSGDSSPRKVDLVYVPPIGSNYSNSLPGSRTVSRRSSVEDVYQHREAYLSVGTGSQSSSSVSSPSTSPRNIPSVGIVPSAQPRSVYATHAVPVVESPRHEVDGAEVDAYDYFEGASYGEEYASRRVRFPRSSEDAGHTPGGVLRYAQGGASSVPIGRSSERDEDVVMEERTELVSEPMVGVDQSGEGDESASPVQPKSVSTPVPVPRVSSAHVQPPSPNLLSPPEIPPSRGRSPQVVSGGELRGRSVTRSSSYSDRGRSGSRGSRSTDSPMGSISPCGSSAAIGAGHYGRDSRGREGRGSYPRTPSRAGSEDSISGRERGRDRTGRRLNESLSPPSPQVPSSSHFGDRAEASSSGHGKDSSGSSLAKPAHIDLPPPIPEEDEQRSRNPTPASSPVSSLKPAFPIAPPNPALPSAVTMTSPPSGQCSSTPAHTKSNSMSSSLPSPTHQRKGSADGLDQSGLMGRAVSSAKGFLGSFWASN